MTNQLSTIECVRTHLKEYLAHDRLEDWIKSRAPVSCEPFYASIDLRDAGFKLAPVDANLYPAGFNNICEEDMRHADSIIQNIFIRQLGRIPKKIAILPENNTRNLFYSDNLFELRHLFRQMGIQTEIGWWDESHLNEAPSEPITLQTSDGRTLSAYPFWKLDNKLLFAPFEPEFILLNNDFSASYPSALTNISQPIGPSPQMGWHSRKKSDFFLHYNCLASELAKTLHLDPWCLNVSTKLVTKVDFNETENSTNGMRQIADAVDEILSDMRKEYAAREILEEPFVFVKNNAGTYGRGILRVQNGSELLSLNRREKNKMAVGKNNTAVHDVIVQEGIPTRFQVDNVYAEPVIYLFGHELMGGFLRTNPTRGKVDNLNSKGMLFKKLCISDLRSGTDRNLELELVYGTIAQLSAAAMSLEIAHKHKESFATNLCSSTNKNNLTEVCHP